MPPMISASRITGRVGIGLRTSFVHPQRAPAEHRSVHGSDSGYCLSLRHLDKGNTAGHAGVSVHDDRDPLDRTVCRKNFSQLMFCDRNIKVPDKNIGHVLVPAHFPNFRPGNFDRNFKRGDVFSISPLRSNRPA
jgi:hypothetical protein